MTTEDVHHPLFARLYARLSRSMEAKGLAEHRSALLSGVAGRVVEVGAGNGLNFAHYPPAVTQVVAVEPEPYLRARAVEAAQDATVPVQVTEGVAQALPLEDASVDVAVCSLVLCSVPDQAQALKEVRRVLRPGGELRFFEHVRARGGTLATVQRRLDVLWPRLAGGCHASRDTVAAIEAAGFTLEELDRFRFPDTRVPSPTAPHVIGRASLPPTPDDAASGTPPR